MDELLTGEQVADRYLPDGRFVNRPVKPEFGVNLKYTLSPNITLDAAINPDFAEIEADAPVIDRWLGLPSFRAELAAAGFSADDAAIRAATQRLAAATRASADAVFNNFLDLVGRPNRRRPRKSVRGARSPRGSAGDLPGVGRSPGHRHIVGSACPSGKSARPCDR